MNKTITSNPHYGKATERLGLWFTKPNQNNTRIVKAYVWLSRHTPDGIVWHRELKEMCSDRKQYPQFYVEKFEGNFRSMMTDSAHSHGKVFTSEKVDGDSQIEVWSEVEKAFKQYAGEYV